MNGFGEQGIFYLVRAVEADGTPIDGAVTIDHEQTLSEVAAALDLECETQGVTDDRGFIVYRFYGSPGEP